MLSINPKAGFKFCWSMMVRTLAVVLLGRGAEATSSTSKLFVTVSAAKSDQGFVPAKPRTWKV